MKVLLLNLTCAIFAVISTSLFKHLMERETVVNLSVYETFRNSLKLFGVPLFWVALFCFIGSCLLWFYILATMRMSIVYPLQITLVFTLGTLVSFIFFDEKITQLHLVGLSTILIGIFIMIK